MEKMDVLVILLGNILNTPLVVPSFLFLYAEYGYACMYKGLPT